MADQKPADQLAAIIAQAIAKAISDSGGELTDIAKAGGDAASGGLLGDVQKLTDIISSLLGDIPLIKDLIGTVADPIGLVEGAGGKFGRGFGFGYLLGYLGWQLMNPIMLPIIHEVNAHTTNELFDPATAAGLVAKSILSLDDGRSESSGNGLDDPHFDKLVDAASVRPPLAELIELLRRGEISQQDAGFALSRQGVPTDWRDKLLALSRVLLSPADLAEAQLRGFVDADFAAGYAASLGLLQADYQILVDNVGEPPGLMQLLEAYRREYIDEARLEHGIRESRVRDEWIDVVKDLRFEPMSAAEAINAAVQGHLAYDQAKARAARAGLLPDDFDVAYQNAGEPMAVGEMLDLFNRGEMTQDQVVQGIKESHFKDKYIPFILKRHRRLIPYRTINTIVEHGVRDQAWAIKYLMDLGYTRDDAEALTATSASGKTIKQKQATESQIVALYKGKAITRDEAIKQLAGIGYDSTEADLILSVAAAEHVYSEQQRAVSSIRAAVLGSKIDLAEAHLEMDKIGVGHQERDQLLAQWKIEKAGQVRTLTPAQVAAAVYYGVWSIDEGVAKLIDLGYSENDAKIVVDLRIHAVPQGQVIKPPTKIGS